MIPLAPTAKWVRAEIHFTLAPFDAEGLGLAAAEGTWRAFLDEEVTPRFPDGVLVLEGYGQRRAGDKGEVERTRSRVLVIVHPDAPEQRARVEALRAAYAARTGEKRAPVIECAAGEPRF